MNFKWVTYILGQKKKEKKKQTLEEQTNVNTYY